MVGGWWLAVVRVVLVVLAGAGGMPRGSTCTTHASRPRRLPLPPPYTCTRTRLGSVSIEKDRPDPSRSLFARHTPNVDIEQPADPPVSPPHLSSNQHPSQFPDIPLPSFSSHGNSARAFNGCASIAAPSTSSSVSGAAEVDPGLGGDQSV